MTEPAVLSTREDGLTLAPNLVGSVDVYRERQDGGLRVFGQGFQSGGDAGQSRRRGACVGGAVSPRISLSPSGFVVSLWI
jgi:hypothetical protein